MREHWKRLTDAEPSVSKQNYDLTGLEPEQQEAIRFAAEHAVTLICGGPGTGKSYTAARLVAALGGPGEVAVAAPTGKAAANLGRALGRPAQTLHALLQKPRLPHDLVVVDEGSMIDAGMMARLLQAVKTGARLVLLGDDDQLPPVEAGNLFADLVALSPVCRLTRCLRTDLTEIVDKAEAVKQGKIIETLPLPSIAELAQLEGTILTPLRRGPYGADALNRQLHARRKGPVPIVVKKNDLKRGLSNGDVGILEGGVARFTEDLSVPAALLPPYDYAYVLSVHKSQGSEYDRVHVLLPQGSERFGREMLYTAITRARHDVKVYGDPDIAQAVVSKRVLRLSGLRPDAAQIDAASMEHIGDVG